MERLEFYISKKCNNVFELISGSGVDGACDGEGLKRLLPDTVEASREKHIPIVKIEGESVTVSVGSVEHPMTEEHGILWAVLETDRGVYRKCLETSKAPIVSFCVRGESPIAVYAYCNLHGLWKADL